MPFQRTTQRYIYLVTLLLMTSVGVLSACQREAELYKTFSMPDGGYRLEVYSYTGDASFPGQSGDSSGYVLLKDKANRVINRANIDMVQRVSDPVWDTDRVSQRTVFEFTLPQE
jgi:hypothetical protein